MGLSSLVKSTGFNWVPASGKSFISGGDSNGAISVFSHDNETLNTNSGLSLATSANRMATVSSVFNGYFVSGSEPIKIVAGGRGTSTEVNSRKTIEKINFSSGVVSVASQILDSHSSTYPNAALSSSGGVSSDVAGYYSVLAENLFTDAEVNKFNFSTESVSLLPSLLGGRLANASAFSTQSEGLFVDGAEYNVAVSGFPITTVDNWYVQASSVDVVQFSNDSISVAVAQGSASPAAFGASFQSESHGYICGGGGTYNQQELDENDFPVSLTVGLPIFLDTTKKVDLQNYTHIILDNSLSTPRRKAAGCSSAVNGYVFSGWIDSGPELKGSLTSQTERFTFTADTTSVMSLQFQIDSGSAVSTPVSGGFWN